MSHREIALAAALAVVVGGLYVTQQYIGPLLTTAAIVLIAGEVLVSVVDDVFPREQRTSSEKFD